MIDPKIEPFTLVSICGNGFKIAYESHGTYNLTLIVGNKEHNILIALDNLEDLQTWLKKALDEKE